MAERTFDDFVEQVARERPGVRRQMRLQILESRVRQALVAARKASGLTQRALAEKASWKQPYVARLEGSTDELRECQLGSIEKYMAACGLKVGVFFYREEDHAISLIGAAPVDGSLEVAECFASAIRVADDCEPGTPPIIPLARASGA